VYALPTSHLQRIGAAAREWMRTDFSPAAYRERMLGLYSRLDVDLPAAEQQRISQGSYEGQHEESDRHRAGVAWDS